VFVEIQQFLHRKTDIAQGSFILGHRGYLVELCVGLLFREIQIALLFKSILRKKCHPWRNRVLENTSGEAPPALAVLHRAGS
jgi:hypothetical protein